MGFVVFCDCKSSSHEGERIGSDAPVMPQESDFDFNNLPEEKITEYSEEVKAAYEKLLVRRGFNGAVLVAKNGVVLLEDYKGITNPRTKEPITAETSFHVASVSKTFTGTTIMKLAEENRLSLDNTIQQYFPRMPYKGVTIRMLLCHRSGLPNYLYFMEKVGRPTARFTNEDVINYMIRSKPSASYLPNKRFQYCNTNYVLLASIIERVTGMSFPQYMRDSVFMPLGLEHTYVFSSRDVASYVPTYAGNWRAYPMDKMDCTYGDKNIYSTVRDLFEWDKALYMENFVTKQTLEKAFTPTSFETRSKHNYGLGWRLLIDKSDTLVYHNGKWHGTNAAFARFIQDTTTVIVLGNKYNTAIYKSKHIASAITGNKDEDEDSE